MRITEYLSDSTFKRQIQRNRSQMVKYNDQIASGKRVTKASDDSVSYLSAKLIDEHIRKNEQYQVNANNGLFQARNTQDALDHMNDLLTSFKTLTVQAANESLNAGDRELIASQVASLKEEFVELANSKFNDVYLFAGTNSDQKPFFEDGAAAGGIGTSSTGTPLKVLAGEGVPVETTVTGLDLRDGPEGDLFEIFQSAIDAMNTNDTAAIQDSIDKVGGSIAHVAGLSTDVANQINRLDFAVERLEDRIIGQSGEVSRLTDADIVESMLNFQNAQTSYDAVLGIHSTMMQTSLLNYLR